MLTVGIPKEIKPFEKRVGLTPCGITQLRGHGVRVLVEHNAGIGSGYSDTDYQNAGAEIVPDAAVLYKAADLIQKIKEPLPPEFILMRAGQVVFSFLHLASPVACELVRALKKNRVTAIAYETVEKNGRLPLLGPMSEIAGALSALYAAILKTLPEVRKGLIPDSLSMLRLFENAAAGYPDLPKNLRGCRTVIFGGGVAGLTTAQTMLRLGGEVLMIEMNPDRRLWLKAHFAPEDTRFQCESPQTLPLEKIGTAEVLIGSVHQRGTRAAAVLSEKDFQIISRNIKKIIMDISIDQGGNFPGARPTSYHEPVYRDEYSNLRFAVPNIPSLAGRYASDALNDLTLPLTLAMAQDLAGALRELPELAGAVNLLGGEILLAAVREAHSRT